jgi:cytochrome c
MLYLIVFGCMTGIPFRVSANPLLFDFSGTTAEENGVEIQGASLGSLPAANVTFGDIPTEFAFEGATDGQGAIINADPGEGVKIFFNSIETSRAAFVRCSIRASHASTAITLTSIDQGPDVFVATNSPTIATSFVNRYRRMVLLYAPPSTGFRPMLEIINQSDTDNLTVYLDNVEIYTFGSEEYWSADFLGGDETDPPLLMAKAEDIQVIPTPPLNPLLVTEGKMLFENSHFGRGGNSFTCAICHDDGVEEADELIRPGHTMMNAFSRPHWKNGNAPKLIEAVNTCLLDWMNAETVNEDDEVWKAIEAYIQSLTTISPSKAVQIQIVPPPEPPTGGDFEQGRELYNKLACIECHGRDLLGRVDEQGGLFGPFLAFRPSIPLDHEYIAAKIRQSGANISGTYEGLQLGGNMPFWGADRISDNDVRNLAEFISTASRWNPEPTGTQIGWVADFGTQNSHRVAGQVRIIDERTLQFENFEYDGGGIAVELYLIHSDSVNFTREEGRNGVTAFNFTLGECYGLNTSCTNGNFKITLPDFIDISQYTHVSVWCVPVGVSFGDGKFMPTP